jgi:hypothetical protein
MAFQFTSGASAQRLPTFIAVWPSMKGLSSLQCPSALLLPACGARFIQPRVYMALGSLQSCRLMITWGWVEPLSMFELSPYQHLLSASEGGPAWIAYRAFPFWL